MSLPGALAFAAKLGSAQCRKLAQATAHALAPPPPDMQFSWLVGDIGTPPQRDEREPLLAVARAGFRLLGMRSHAVHINGYTPDGHLWCGRRSPTKATDPGKLDNVIAGGLPAGETPWACAVRALHEEAEFLGLSAAQTLERIFTGEFTLDAVALASARPGPEAPPLTQPAATMCPRPEMPPCQASR